MEGTADIVIIGGGIVGASIAYHLAAAGAGRIMVLEKGWLGEGATAQCAGGIRTQFSTDINIRFSLESLETWDHFEEMFGMPLDFKKVGYLLLVTTGEEWEVLKAACRLQQGYAIPVEPLTAGEIARRWPFLRVDDLAGGTFCARDGHAGPYEALSGFVKAARRLGVRFYENSEVRAITCRGGRITGVRTADDAVSCPVVVNAAGPYAEPVGRMAGIDVPVRPYLSIFHVSFRIVSPEAGWLANPSPPSGHEV